MRCALVHYLHSAQCYRWCVGYNELAGSAAEVAGNTTANLLHVVSHSAPTPQAAAASFLAASCCWGGLAGVSYALGGRFLAGLRLELLDCVLAVSFTRSTKSRMITRGNCGTLNMMRS